MDVLLVDDNEDFLMVMKELLLANGYTILTARDGLEACEVLTNTDIDLIISDIKMPRLDGIKLHAFAREMDRYKQTKFIFLSGYPDLYSGMNHLNPQIDFFMDKTTSGQDIIKFVNEQMLPDHLERLSLN